MQVFFSLADILADCSRKVDAVELQFQMGRRNLCSPGLACAAGDGKKGADATTALELVFLVTKRK